MLAPAYTVIKEGSTFYNSYKAVNTAIDYGVGFYASAGGITGISSNKEVRDLVFGGVSKSILNKNLDKIIDLALALTMKYVKKAVEIDYGSITRQLVGSSKSVAKSIGKSILKDARLDLAFSIFENAVEGANAKEYFTDAVADVALGAAITGAGIVAGVLVAPFIFGAAVPVVAASAGATIILNFVASGIKFGGLTIEDRTRKLSSNVFDETVGFVSGIFGGE